VLENPGIYKHAMATGQEVDSDVHRAWTGNLPLLRVAVWFVHLTTTHITLSTLLSLLLRGFNNPAPVLSLTNSIIEQLHSNHTDLSLSLVT
jgi:hypothetical protein